MVERQLPKLNVDGSSPFARSFSSFSGPLRTFLAPGRVRWRQFAAPRLLRPQLATPRLPASVAKQIAFGYAQPQISLTGRNPELARCRLKDVGIGYPRILFAGNHARSRPVVPFIFGNGDG